MCSPIINIKVVFNSTCTISKSADSKTYTNCEVLTGLNVLNFTQYNAVQSGRSLQSFQTNMLSPCSGEAPSF